MTTMTSDIQVEFGQGNPHWEESKREYNFIFLHCQENYFNDLLKARGFVFLNEICSALCLPWSKLGQTHGWVWNDTESQKIVFDLDASDIDVDNLIRITLNPTGDILDALV